MVSKLLGEMAVQNPQARSVFLASRTSRAHFFCMVSFHIMHCRLSERGTACSPRVRFFKIIRDWILKSDRIQKRILRFFTKQINPRSLGSWYIKGTEESSVAVDFSVFLRHRDPKDLGLICLEKKRKIRFRILLDLRIQSWIFFNETHPES